MSAETWNKTPDLNSSGTDSSIQQMEQAFDFAIAKSAQITALTTMKKAELDATKQRPQN